MLYFSRKWNKKEQRKKGVIYSPTLLSQYNPDHKKKKENDKRTENNMPISPMYVDVDTLNKMLENQTRDT